MKNRKECGKIYRRNPLFKRLAVLMVLLFCVESVWAGVYEWTGGAGDLSWTTPGNWKLNGVDAMSYPGNNGNAGNDDVVVKTASGAVNIVLPKDIQIHGFITYGQNTCTISSENFSFNVSVLLIGSSANWYRIDSSRLPNVNTDYVPNSDENKSGSLKIQGSTTVNIVMIDTSSWTESYEKKNELSVSYGASVNISTWETGSNTQEFKDESGNIIGTNTNRVQLEIEGNVVSETVNGSATDELKSEIEKNPNAVNVNENTFIWTGNAGDGKWSTAGNWKNNVVPNANTAEVLIKGTASSITIESAESFTVKTLNFSDNPSLKISGTLTIEENLGSAFNIIDSESVGKLIVAKNIIPPKSFDSSTLEIECKNLELTKNFKTKALSINDTGIVTFNGSEDQTFNVNSVSLSDVAVSKAGGKVSFLGGTTFTNFLENSTSCDYYFDGSVVFTNIPNSGKGFQTIGTVFITENCNSFNVNDDLSFIGDLIDKGTWDGTGKIIFNGTGDQTFTPKAGTTYSEIQENKSGGKLTVTSALNATAVTLTKGTDTSFNGSVTLSSFTDAVGAGNVSFNAGGTISSDTVFNTTGDVTFSGNTALSFGANTAEHTAGKTILKGNVTASTLSIGNGSLEGNSTITGYLTFNGGIDESGRCVFDRSSTANGVTLTVTNNITSTGFYSLGDARAITLVAGTATFTNNGNLKIPHSSSITANFENSGTLSAGGSGTDSACKINGTFTNTGYVIIPDGKYLNVTGTVDDSAGTGWNADNQTGTLQFTGLADQSFVNKDSRTYASINVKLNNGKTLSVSNPLTITNLKLTSGNLSFSQTVTVINYSETLTPSGAITFNGSTAIFENGVTFNTTGTVTVASRNTLSAAENKSLTFNKTDIKGTVTTTGTGTQTYKGITTLSGSISSVGNVSFDNDASLEVQSAMAEVSGADIKTPAISTSSTSNNITLKSTTGNFTTGQIGANATNKIGTGDKGFNTVTFNSEEVDLTVNSRKIFAQELKLETTGSITVNKLSFDGELKLNTASSVSLNGGSAADEKLSVKALSYENLPLYIYLSGIIEVTGIDGFVIPVKAGPVYIPVALSDATKIITTGTDAPVTLYDNITGGKNLTVTNAGIFTLNETSAVSDPATFDATPASSCSVGTFIQDGAGAVNIAGDISASGDISFASDVSLSDNVVLITDSGKTVNFTGGNTSVSDSASGNTLIVTGGTLVVNKTNQSNTLAVNIPVIANSDFTVTQGTVTGNGDATVKGNFSDAGTWSGTGKIILSGSADQTFTPGTSTYQNIEVNKTGKISFIANTLTVNEITLTSSENVVFGTAVELNVITDAATTGNITFEAGSSIGTDTTFVTTGQVQFGNDSSDAVSFGTNSVTHTTGKTVINGSLAAKNTSFSETELTGTITASGTADFSGKLTVNGTVDSASTLTISDDLLLSENSTFKASTINVTGGSDASNKKTISGGKILTLLNHSAGTAVEMSIADYSEITSTEIIFSPVTGKLINNGNLSVGSDISINGNFTNAGTFFLGTYIIAVSGDVTNSSIFNNNSGTVSVKGNVSNSGTWDKNTGIIKICGTGTTLISGLKDFYNLTIDSSDETGSKAVKIPAGSGNAITVSNALFIKGNSSKNLSVVSDAASPNATDSTWWYLNQDIPSVSVSYAKIGYAYSYGNISSSVTDCEEILSSDNYTTFNWFGSHKYIWTGASNSLWGTAGNWKNDKGGVFTQAPYKTDASAEIEISEGSATGADRLLILDGDISVKSFTVDAKKRVDLTSCGVTAETITNNGIIALDGTKTVPLSGSITHDDDSEIEFKGWTSGIAVQTTPAGLGLGSSTTYNFKKLLITGNASYEFEFPSGSTINADSVKINASVGKTNSLSSLKVTGISDINSNLIKTTGGQEFGDSVNLLSDIEFINTGTDSKVKFDGTVDGSVTLIVNADVDLNGPVTTNEKKQHYKKSVTILNDIALTGSQVQFDGTVSGNAGLTVNAETLLNGGSVNTTGNQLYKNNVILGNTTILTAAQVQFDGTVSGTYELTVNADAVLNGETVTTTGNNQNYNKKVTLQKNTTLTAAQVQFDGEVSGGYDLTVKAKAVLKGGSVTTAGENQKYNQHYENIVTLGNTTTLTAAQVQFDGEVSGDYDLTVNAEALLNGGKVTTTDKTQVYKNIVTIQKDTELTGSTVTFENTLDGLCPLSIKGNAVFGGEVGKTDKLVSLNVDGSAEINGGEINTSSTQLYKDAVTLGNDTSFAGTTVTFNSDVTGTGQNLTFNSANAVLKGKVSVKDFVSNAILESKNEADVTIQGSGKIELNKTFDLDKVILASGEKTSFNENGNIATATITNEGVLELAQDKTITVSGKLTQNGNGNNDIKGSVVTSGSGEVSFAQNVYVNGNPSPALTFGGGSGKFVISKNLIVALENDSDEFKVSSPLTADNIVLYSGKLLAGKNISSVKDFVLLGSSYSKDDGNAAHKGEYLYTKKRNAEFNYKDFGTETLPDGSAISASYKGELSVTEGVSLNAGKNFYGNGLKISGTGLWFLDAGKNSDSKECFIEAYNCEISNSSVRNKGTVNSSLTTGMAQNCTDSGNNDAWDFDDFEIVDVETVSDSVLKVTFNKPVRNHNRELTSLVTKIHYDSGTKYYSEVYDKYQFSSGTWLTNGIGTNETDTVYLRTTGIRWNTDAAGTSSGNEHSTDSTDVHRTTIPNLTFDRNVEDAGSPFGVVFTDRFGKILKDSGTLYNKVSDGASPVLVKVVTGQENHTRYDSSVGPDSQPSYDAHNFIEFVYSEPVDFDNVSEGTGTLNLVAATSEFENERVENSLGAVSQEGDKIKVSGLAVFTGKLNAGNRNNRSKDSTVHSFYRKVGMNPHEIRLSVAGYVDGTVEDNDGRFFKNWIGYIDEAETPSGEVKLPLKENGGYLECPVFDLADQAAENAHPTRNRIQSVKEGLSVTGSLWDVTKPSFATYRKAAVAWNDELLNGHFEAIGSTVDGTSSLKRIEFHMFDNTPSYDENTDSAYWVSRKGWVSSTGADAGLVSTDSENGTFAADDFGGSRMFDSNRTSGGIRYSSIVDSAQAFKHLAGDDFNLNPDTVFDETKKAYFNVTSPIFIATEGSVRTPNYADSPYFGLTLKESIPSVKTTFIVSYDDTKGFVTDLAGNRLDSAKIRTIDTTPPSFVMSLAPVGQKKLYLMFAKRLNFDETVNLKNLDSGESENKNLLEFFTESFVLGSIDGTDFVESDLKIDSNIKPIVHLGNLNVSDTEQVNKDYCSVEVCLNREVTYDDVKNLYVQCKPLGNKFQDPVTGLDTKVATFVQDDTGVGNYLPAYSAHSLSDFAVNAVNPVYAYNAAFNAQNDATKSGLVQKNLFGENSFGVHDWDAEQKNFGTLLPDDEIHIIASAVSKDAMNSRIYLDNSPESGTVSDEYNRISGSNLRVWLPEVPGLELFKTIAFKANPVESYIVTDGKVMENADVSNGVDFLVPEDAVKLWASGDQVSFLFGMTESDGSDVRMCHSPVFDYQTEEYTVNKDSPLFALRLKDSSDILSLDLWSFRLKEMILQKGGVTILNNVINAGNGEKAVVRVDNPKTGRVDVIVMTLDGNVIEYLHRGELEAGNENYFTWNGKNRAGRAVARGMYFVRVIGNGFDETRKIMVVK
ncbi:MAG: hypothetical protein MJ185_01400 [Treponema sp.]|nr:hypothetical protein [Treponema sp.]